MNLPLLISVPHAGIWVPPEVEDRCRLSDVELAADGDEQAAELYSCQAHVARWISTPVARAIVDLNREISDRRSDGVVKTHTCWNVPVYDRPLDEELIDRLLEKYYHPYHRQLSAAAGEVRLGIDCHTMAEHGPPVGPDPGQLRPAICLGDVQGTSLPGEFEFPVTINQPSSGGYITRCHAAEMPWVQIEFSRGAWLPLYEKRGRLMTALCRFCRELWPDG